jgi:WD40 repeat protein
MLKGHLSAITAVSFSPDDDHVVTASADGLARVWAANGALIAELKGHQGSINSVAFSPDGTRIITASNDKTARVWTSDGSLVTEIKRQGEHGMKHWERWGTRLDPSTVFSADGARLVTTLGEKAWMWKSDGALIAELEGHKVLVNSAAFSADGRYVATTSIDGKARVYGLDGGLVAELPHEKPIVSSAAFSADGTRVVTVSGSVPQGRDNVGVWRLDDKTRMASFQGHGQVLSATFVPNGLRIVASLDDTTVGVWTADGALVARLPDHSSKVTLATFSADGQRIFTASEDGSARMWMADGTPVAHIDPYGVKVLSAAFSADNMYVVMGSEDGAARLWTSDGALVAVLDTHGGPVHSVAFSPDGRQVITTSHDTISRVWTIHPDVVRRALWFSTRFCLGTEERMRLLHAQESIAEAGYKNCTDMIRCLEEGPGGERYPGCLDEYRRKERARLHD